MHSSQSSGHTLSFQILKSFAESRLNKNCEQQQVNFGLKTWFRAVTSIKINSRRKANSCAPLVRKLSETS